MTNRAGNGLLSRDVTSLIKGMAILLMLWHHLFGVYEVKVDPSILANENALFDCFHEIAWRGKICVGLFILVTGYGYRICAEKERSWGPMASWHRIRKFYPLFCLVCIANVALVAAFPPTDLPVLLPWWKRLMAMIGHRHYIYDYWYIIVVLTAAFALYPLLLWALRRGTFIHGSVFGCICLLVCFGNLDWIPWVNATHFCLAWSWMPYFLAGWALGSVRLEDGYRSLTLPGIWAGILALRFLMIHSMGSLPISLDVRHMRLTLICVLLACLIHRLPRYLWSWLAVLGAYSAVMWLNHRLIFGYWFADFFYGLPTPVNYLLLVVLSFALAYPITKGWNRLLRWWEQRRVSGAEAR